MLSKGDILINDCKSKFGTLVLMQKSVELNENKLCLQIGRTVVECIVEKQIKDKEDNTNSCDKFNSNDIISDKLYDVEQLDFFKLDNFDDPKDY